MESSSQFDIRKQSDEMCSNMKVDEYMANLMHESRIQAVRSQITSDRRSLSRDERTRIGSILDNQSIRSHERSRE